ncbi:MFS transporter [Streptomyces sp. NPDC019890]|uniref:MFS transporter n=1 Tax=Streptomyces sp. NPDC019890 TaxID=3365064 RepID=UPI00384EC98E
MTDVQGPPRHDARIVRKVALASAIGTTVEWYDYFAYAAATALVFGPLFFPQLGGAAATFAAFVTFAMGYLIRPLGGVVFGHLGDRIGRKSLLVVSLLLTGLATFAIGLLPTYAVVGPAAPVLLLVLRLIQGVGVSGEWGGAVLMAVEHAPDRKRGFYGSWPQIGVPAGIILANLVFLIITTALSPAQFLSWGWRVPFLIAIVPAAVGLFIRLRVAESPVFTEVKQARTVSPTPILEVLRSYWKQVILGSLAAAANIAVGYLILTYGLTYGTAVLKLSRPVMLSLVLITAAVGGAGIPFFSALSDRVGRRKVFLTGAIGQAVWAVPFFLLFNTRTPLLILLAFIVMQLASYAMYGPMATIFAEIFGARVRYTGVSLCYQLGVILGGAFTPAIATSLLASTGTALSISAYIVAISLVSAVAAFALGEPSRNPLAGEKRADPERAAEHTAGEHTRPEGVR